MFNSWTGFQWFKYHILNTTSWTLLILKSKAFSPSQFMCFGLFPWNSLILEGYARYRSVSGKVSRSVSAVCCIENWIVAWGFNIKPFHMHVSIGDFTICAVCKSSSILTLSSKSAAVMSYPLLGLSLLLLEKTLEQEDWEVQRVYLTSNSTLRVKWGDIWKEAWTWK